MTKFDIVRQIATKTGVEHEKVKQVVQLTLDGITDVLSRFLKSKAMKCPRYRLPSVKIHKMHRETSRFSHRKYEIKYFFKQDSMRGVIFNVTNWKMCATN
jgi:hypothetical protein